MSLYALHLANGRTSNTGVFRLMGRLLSGTGVIESTGFTVSAQGTPDMTVKVSGSTLSDNLVIITATGDTYHGWNTANANVTITANATGVTKKDHIVAYIDTALTTTTPDNPGGLVLIAVRGTGTAAPTDAEINAVPAISSKPWLRLAEITIANGAGSINSGNIVDLRVVIGLRAGLVTTLAVVPRAITNSTLFGWDSGSSSQTIAPSGSGQWPGTVGQTLTTSGGLLDITVVMTGFSLSTGNAYLGLIIDGVGYESNQTTNQGQPCWTAHRLLAAGTIAAGSHTVVPYGRSTGGTLTWAAFNTVTAVVREFIR